MSLKKQKPQKQQDIPELRPQDGIVPTLLHFKILIPEYKPVTQEESNKVGQEPVVENHKMLPKTPQTSKKMEEKLVMQKSPRKHDPEASKNWRR